MNLGTDKAPNLATPQKEILQNRNK